MSRPTATYLLVAAWVAVPLLGVGLNALGGSLEESWRTDPPTEQEATDCRIEAMMGGDNPVEVERIETACLQAANDAYVEAKLRPLTATFAAVLLAYVLALVAVTWKRASASG
jgi:hypothetical protein